MNRVQNVVLRSVGLTMMVVAPSPADAIALIQNLPEVLGTQINAAEAKPMGGPEYLKMTQDFVTETETYIPGIDEGWNVEERARLAVWLVTISYTLQVGWEQRSAGTEAGEGEGRVAGSIGRATDVDETTLRGGSDS